MRHSILEILFLISFLCSATPEPRGFVNVADFVAADGIQRLIYANPNRTLWFADGTYLISHPICATFASISALFAGMTMCMSAT